MSREARQRVTFRPGARIGVIAASLAAAAALALPTTALASTTQIGSTSTPGTVFTCPSTIDLVQSMSGGASYAVPSGGTSITQWSIQAGAGDTGSAALEVWSPTATPPLYQLVGISPLELLTPGTLNTFDLSASPITVAPGDLIGLHVEGAVSCAIYTGGAADLIQFGVGPTPAVSGTEALDQVGQAIELNVAATVEAAPNPNPVPTTTKQCKGGGWQKLTDTAGTSFKNQGDCVSFVATGGTNTAAGS